MNIHQIDWNKNPVKFKMDMNENFLTIKKTYELLAEKVIEKVTKIKSENENEESEIQEKQSRKGLVVSEAEDEETLFTQINADCIKIRNYK